MLIHEVGPRDGLQNEPAPVSTADKIAFVDRLSTSGLRSIEVTAFVSPKWVPQMADAAEVLAGISRRPGVRYSALVPNLRGLERAIASAVRDVAVFAAASETFSRRNINCSIAESLARFAPVAEAARDDGTPLRGYVSCATDCPYEGRIDPSAVGSVTESLFALGCREVSLADTIGRATPDSVARMLQAALDLAPPDRLAGHFHDTGGRALDNIEVALDYGLRVFDAACGGLGGCPFAPGAAGNVATERVVARLEAKGFVTGLDASRLGEAAKFALRLRSAG